MTSSSKPSPLSPEDLEAWYRQHYGPIEGEFRSDYAHLRLRKKDTMRSLFSVSESGDLIESRLDLSRPHRLTHDYLRFMFCSYLFRPRQQRVAIIGLGGGNMVHFLRRYDPAIRIDAVEIDPVMVRIADEYFDIRSDATTDLVTADGCGFLLRGGPAYDTIYMDAFLRPSADTDGAGAPRALRTAQFYRRAQARLRPGGLMAFNLNPHDSLEGDVRTLRESFVWVREFPLGEEQGMVAVASGRDYSAIDLPAAARVMDRRFQAGFSFEELLRRAV